MTITVLFPVVEISPAKPEIPSQGEPGLFSPAAEGYRGKHGRPAVEASLGINILEVAIPSPQKFTRQNAYMRSTLLGKLTSLRQKNPLQGH